MHKRVLTILVGAGLAGLVFMMPSARAGTILVFGQNGISDQFEATNNGSLGVAGGTRLSAVNVEVTIDGIANVVPTPGSYPDAFLSLSAKSVSNATTVASGQIIQDFSGSFSITSMPDGGGTNYLSGTFDNAVFGSGTGLVMTGSGPLGVPTLTSDVIAALAQTRAMSLSFTNVTSAASITADETLSAFSSNVSGSFSGTPEPASVVLLAIGASGLLAVRRRFKRAASA
jgi:hypothetical protein